MNIPSSRSPSFAVALLLLAGANALRAQAQLHWQPGETAPGPTSPGDIYDVAWWDPDGAGPSGAVLVVAGIFTVPSLGARHLAWFDPATGRWGAFAAQPNGQVSAVVALSNGQLAIGGAFTAIGAQPAAGIAIGDGVAWSSPGGGIAPVSFAAVTALLALPNGDVVVGGSFTQAGTVATTGLARWDGSQWHAYWGFSHPVSCLTRRANGNLVVGGSFPTNVAEWNGVAWTTFVPGLAAAPRAVAELANGDIVASGGAFNVARWDGSSWTNIGAALQGQPDALLPLPNGGLLAGTVQVIGNPAGVAHWDGSQWTVYAPMPSPGTVRALTRLPNGDLLAAGWYGAMPGGPHRGLVRWDGAAWHAMGSGFDDTVAVLLPFGTGALAFGDFQLVAGANARNVARWNGTAWSTFGGTTFTPFGTPTCGTTDAAGAIWVAGSGSTVWPPPGNVGRWSGTAWQAVGTAVTAPRALLVDGGQPIVGCAVYPQTNGQAIARWNGTQWQGYGNGLDGPVLALLRRSNGELVAGGEFLFSGTTGVSRIARWNGTAWLPFGPGVDGPVRALAELPDGTLIAAGDFVNDGTLVRPLNLVARWDGTDWQALGTGLAGAPGTSVRALHVLPDGDLLAGGDFLTANGAPARGVARWNGAQWSAVDGGIDGMVLTLARLADGEVLAGGDFAAAGPWASAHVARLRTDSPATTVAYGASCAGTAGPLVLTATALPWLGSTYRAACAPVTASAIGVDVFGLAIAQVPLPSLLPTGVAGCSLLATPDFATVRPVANGTILASLALPEATALLGVVVHHQVLVAEVDATLAITRLAGSNGLTLTIGGF